MTVHRPVDHLYTGRREAIESKTCFRCGRPAVDFADDVSVREYELSGLCQECQDFVFVELDEDTWMEAVTD